MVPAAHMSASVDTSAEPVISADNASCTNEGGAIPEAFVLNCHYGTLQHNTGKKKYHFLFDMFEWSTNNVFNMLFAGLRLSLEGSEWEPFRKIFYCRASLVRKAAEENWQTYGK
jgi:hypothetical protein